MFNEYLVYSIILYTNIIQYVSHTDMYIQYVEANTFCKDPQHVL